MIRIGQLICFLILFLFANSLFSQSEKELLANLDTAKSEFSRAYIYGQLGMHYLLDLEKGLLYANKSLEAAENAGDSLLISNGKFLIGYVYFNNRKFQEGYSNFNLAFEDYISLGELQGAIYSCYYSGFAFSDRGENYRAIESFEKGLALAQITEDPHLINLCLNALGPVYCLTNQWGKGEKVAKEAVLIAHRDSINLNSTYNQLALVYQMKGQYNLSLKYFNLSNKFLGENPHYRNSASDFQNRSQAYLMTGKYDSALHCVYGLLEVARANKDEFIEAQSFQELAKFHLEMGDLSKAEQYLNQALCFASERIDSVAMLDLLVNIQIEMDELQKARNTLDLVDHLSKQLNLDAQKINSSNFKGLLLFMDGDFEGALVKHFEALELARELGNSRKIPDIYLNLSQTFFEMDRFQEAAQYADSALVISKESFYRQKLDEMYLVRSKADFMRGHFQDAYLFTTAYQEIKDSLLNADKNKQIAQLTIEYDVKEKETENDLLKANKLRAEAQVQSRTTVAIALIAILTLVSIIAIILKRNVKFKQQQNEALEKEVQERSLQIIEQNKELLEIRQIQGLQQAKSKFFANVSHEFRTPLTLIQGTIKNLLSDNAINPKFHKSLERADRNSMQLTELITELLDISKIETETLKLDLIPLNVFEEINSLIDRFGSMSAQKSIQLTLDYQLDRTFVTLLDQSKFTKILNNLISNALKFTHKSGKIEVVVALGRSDIQIRVSDTGIGIPKDELDLVFQRFYQVENKTGNHSPDQNAYHAGTGIGLSLCQEYVNLFGGEIWAESPGLFGTGTTFILNIPFQDSTEHQINLADSSSEFLEVDQHDTAVTKKTSPKASVLVVEDNLDLNAFLRETLETHYIVYTAENGQEALELLVQPKISISMIVSDVMMPVMDGFSFIEKVKANDELRHIPVIMLTARAELRDRMKALRIGVDDYLLKPFEKKDLIKRIEELLKRVEFRIQDLPDYVDENESVKRQLAALELSQKEYEWLSTLEEEAFKLISNFNYTAEDLALALNISRATFFRQVKQLTGLTVNQYIKEYRLQTARKLLEEEKVQSVKEIAYTVGFKHINYFSKSFEERFGKRPSDYFNNLH